MSEKFGPYEIIRKIAAGGMAEVLLAKQVGMGGFERLVCLKRILPHLAEEDDFVRMFQDEARIAANLMHPNIAQIYDIGESGDHLFIAMEYVRGEDLRHVYNQEVARGRTMPQEVAAHVAMGCAAGLDHAHRQTSINGRPLGIVHRDISPQNILITYDGHVKIVDFGVAKAAGKMAQTRAGVLKGKYSYMSPEQASGDPIDGRTDIFALGVTLYEVTTGTRLFKRDNELDTLHAVLGCQVTPPTELRRSFHPDLEQIVLKALSYDADERYQTAGDMERALESYLLCHDHPPGPSSLGAHMQELFADKLADELLFGNQQAWEEKDTPSPMKRRSGSRSRKRPDSEPSKKRRGGGDPGPTRVLDGSSTSRRKAADQTGATVVDVRASQDWREAEANAPTEAIDLLNESDHWKLDSGDEPITMPQSPVAPVAEVTTPRRPSRRTPDTLRDAEARKGDRRTDAEKRRRTRRRLDKSPALTLVGMAVIVGLLGGALGLFTPTADDSGPPSRFGGDANHDSGPGEHLVDDDETKTALPDDDEADETGKQAVQLGTSTSDVSVQEMAWLSVETSPIPMTVSVRGRRLGDTPLSKLPIEPGSYRLRLTSKTEGVSVRRRVKLVAGRHEALRVELGRGALVVNATPWAWVKIGRRPPRETPLRVSLPEGEYTIIFECPKGTRHTKTVSVPRDETAKAVVSCAE